MEKEIHAGRQTDKPRSGILYPTRGHLHPSLRIAVGAAINVLLAAPMVLHFQPPFLPGWILAQLLVPVVALVILLPVILRGRDVPRVLAIGLSFFPAFLVITGFKEALSLVNSRA